MKQQFERLIMPLMRLKAVKSGKAVYNDLKPLFRKALEAPDPKP